MIRRPDEQLEQMSPDDILWIGSLHTESDFENERADREFKRTKKRLSV
jgi:hypothetical protein